MGPKRCSHLAAATVRRYLVGMALLLFVVVAAWAEYGDIVINKRSVEEGVRPVIFPHWFHRIRFKCRVCHSELGFEMRAGGNDMTMDTITQGKYCGACHNGEIAWSTEHCDLCHSGLPKLKTGIFGGHETGGPGRY